MSALTQGRTSIVISHDVAMIRGLDRVVWLEDGQIVEDGAPSELAAAADSRFARWIRSQADEAGSVPSRPVEVTPAPTALPAEAGPRPPVLPADAGPRPTEPPTVGSSPRYAGASS